MRAQEASTQETSQAQPATQADLAALLREAAEAAQRCVSGLDAFLASIAADADGLARMLAQLQATMLPVLPLLEARAEIVFPSPAPILTVFLDFDAP
ncbi:MAG TPA: hypothetical protein VFC25_06250 [Verrucomicrobiae bacterium]|nr:hypothetical protein [Verrucomicrobiae bacterium]